MEIAIVLGGAIGAWLLVAGPIYQAAIELGEMHFDREGMEAIESAVPQPPGCHRGGGCSRPPPISGSVAWPTGVVAR